MTMQQWVNVMRKAGCEIVYFSGIEHLIYIARNKDGKTIGVWIPKDNRGSIIVSGELIMTWEFTE